MFSLVISQVFRLMIPKKGQDPIFRPGQIEKMPMNTSQINPVYAMDDAHGDPI
jgi:hypothetical protein